MFVEVRVPTYKRNAWLRNAIGSLLDQDTKHWKAIIFDDDPYGDAEKITRSFNDKRITYRKNTARLGAAQNINQCFEPSSILGGRYACVLEDDNWLYPDFITSNIECIHTRDVQLIHRNQDIWSRATDPPVLTGNTTLGQRYIPGLNTSSRLHAYSFFSHGLSNGALFWRTGIRSRLRVPNLMNDPSMHEFFRCLSIVDTSWFATEPKAAWADVPITNTQRQYSSGPVFGAFLRKLRRAVYIEEPDVRNQLKEIADAFGLHDELTVELSYLGLIPPSRAETIRSVRKRVRGALKGLWYAGRLRHVQLSALRPTLSYTLPTASSSAAYLDQDLSKSGCRDPSD